MMDKRLWKNLDSGPDRSDSPSGRRRASTCVYLRWLFRITVEISQSTQRADRETQEMV